MLKDSKQGSTLTTSDIDNAINCFYSTGAPNKIQVFGGEPLLFPDLVSYVIEKILEADHKTKIEINTNGTLISDAFLQRHYNENQRIAFSISLDSANAENNNYYRKAPNGDGSFQATKKGISTVIGYGYPCDLLYTPQTGTIRSLPRLIPFASNIGVRSVMANTPHSLDQNGWQIDGSLLAKSLLLTKEIAKHYGVLFVSEIDKACYLLSNPLSKKTRCSNQNGLSIAWTSDNMISSCLVNTSSDKMLFLGHPKSLKMVKESSNTPVNYASGCNDCPAERICMGGCFVDEVQQTIGRLNRNRCLFYTSLYRAISQ